MIINLLPEAQKKINTRYYVLNLTFYLGIVLCFLNLSLMIYFIYGNFSLKEKILKQEKQLLQSKNPVLDQNLAFLKNQIQDLNLILDNLDGKISKKEREIPYVLVFQSLASYVDSGLKVEQIETSPNDGNIIIMKGRAINRETLLNLQKNLEQDSLFSEVKYSLQDLIGSRDLNFIFLLKIKHD